MTEKREYILALSAEKDALTEENREVRRFVREETLEMTAPPSAEEILKKTAFRYYTKILLTVLLCVCLLTGLTLLGMSFYRGVTRPTVEDESLSDTDFLPDTTENLNRAGSASGLSEICVQNGIFYYKEGNSVFRLKNGEKSLLSQTNAAWLNAYQYCLYYYNTDTKEIVRFRTDGKDTRILKTGEEVRRLEVYNSTVFYLTEGGVLKSVYINGKSEYTLVSGMKILGFVVWDGKIYFTAEEEEKTVLYRCHTGGGSPEAVTVADRGDLCLADGRVCYLHNGVLYAFSPEEEKSYSVFSGVTEFAFLNGSFLLTAEKGFYTASADGSSVKECEIGFDTAEKILSVLGGGVKHD